MNVDEDLSSPLSSDEKTGREFQANRSSKRPSEDVPKYTKISSAVAEGDANMKLHNWERAEIAYTRALELNPMNKSALVNRSKCYMNLGRFDEAIKDADHALSLDTKYYKGFLQKAESLYACGKFEFALVYYYKGFMLRKDIQDFRRGIRKAKIAINESIEQDLLDLQLAKNNKFFDKRQTQSMDSIVTASVEEEPPKKINQKIEELRKLPEKDVRSPLPPHMTEDYPGKLGETTFSDNIDRKRLSKKKLLGEFTEDEKYLQNLLKDKTFKKDIDGKTKDNKIYDLVSSTLSFLEKRKQFWKHSNTKAQLDALQSPSIKRRPASASAISKRNRTSTSLSSYDTPTQCQQRNNMYDKTLDICKMSFTENFITNNKKSNQQNDIDNSSNGKDEEEQGKMLYSIANIHLQRNEFDHAIECFEKYLEIGRKGNNISMQAKALTCLGNVYLAMSKYYEQNPHLHSRYNKIMTGNRIDKDEYVSRALYYQRMAMKIRSSNK